MFDPSQYALQVKKRLEEAERHLKTFDNAVKQLTTLKGVLEQAEDLVAKQRGAISTMSNIGRTVRGVYQLKDQLEAIVISRMGALRSINERLRNGIFDPEADMRDFEEYLRNSIGRSSQDTVANLQRLMKMDNQLKRMNDDLEKARVGLAGAELSKQEAENKHEEELAKPESERCASCIANLDEQMSNYDLLIAHYYSEIARLVSNHQKTYKFEQMPTSWNVIIIAAGAFEFGTLNWVLPNFWCKQDFLLFILMNTASPFADPNLLQLEHISSEPNRITLIVKTKSKQALCPRCHSPSAHLHSRYVRRLADLPWLGIAVRCHTTVLIAIPSVCLALLHVLVSI